MSDRKFTTGGDWPSLPLAEWWPTYTTLNRWAQIVGKTRLALSPFENHWWHCALYVSARGLTTSAMPFGGKNVEVEFDFISDALFVRVSDGRTQIVPLRDQSVAAFYRAYCDAFAALGMAFPMHAWPNELPDATPFAADDAHATYDGDAVRRWWRILSGVDQLLKAFRGEFVGKCSPSHLWWGGFDIACTRFSGRRAPTHSGGVPNCPDYVQIEAYSHECISAGWWPGSINGPVTEPSFYAYAYPEPDGCRAARIEPDAASYHSELREWVLPYDAVRKERHPDVLIMQFLRSTYDAAATLGGWDVEALAHRGPTHA